MTRFSLPLELPDVGLDRPGDEHRHVVGDVGLFRRRLLADDRDFHLEVRGLDVGDQSPLEPGTQPLLERRDFLWQGVGGHDDLLLRVVQRVERVEELLLGRVLAGDELDVVHQEHVELTVAALEFLHALETQGIDEVVQETLGRQIQDLGVRIAALHLLRDRMHEVGLPEADTAVEKQGVVRTRGRFGDGAGRRVGELVGSSDDEALEGKTWIGGDGGGRARGGRGGGSRRGVAGAGFEPDLQLRITGGRSLAGEERSVAGFDPVGKNSRGDRNGQDPLPGRRIEGDLPGRPEPRAELLRIELFLDLLEDGGPDLGH